MIKKIKKRLESRSGESIAEVLVAMMVSAVALVLLAYMIMSSTGMVEKSSKTMREYVNAENGVAIQGGTPDRVSHVSLSDNGSAVKLTDETDASVTVDCYKINTGDNAYVSYKVKKDAT